MRNQYETANQICPGAISSLNRKYDGHYPGYYVIAVRPSRDFFFFFFFFLFFFFFVVVVVFRGGGLFLFLFCFCFFVFLFFFYDKSIVTKLS